MKTLFTYAKADIPTKKKKTGAQARLSQAHDDKKQPQCAEAAALERS